MIRPFKGLPAGVLECHFTGRHPVNNPDLWYRQRQTDTDDHYMHSGVIRLSLHAASDAISLYTNPVCSSSTLQGRKSRSGRATVKAYRQSGQYFT